MGKITRLKDIAIAAEVSTPVVSAILNNKGERFRQETRERIWRLAKEMNYFPAFSGRSLVTGKSYNIALAMPARYGGALSGHNLNIFHGLSLAIERTDYNLVIFFGCGEKYYTKLKQRRLDGVIVLQSTPDYDVISRSVETGLPVLVLNLDIDVEKAKDLSCVRSDHESLVKNAFKVFIEAGCKKILSINDYVSPCNPNIIIYEEFNRQCQKYSSEGVFGTTFCPSSKFKDQLYNMFNSGQKWDGYFVDGSDYADELIEVAAEFGLKNDEDYKLFVSSTDTHRMKFDYPCYLHSQREMGRTAWEMMEKMLSGETLNNKKVLIKYRPAEELHSDAIFNIDYEWEQLESNN